MSPVNVELMEKSADTQEEGQATGAMSYAFITSLKKCPRQSYMQLLQTVREEMKGESRFRCRIRALVADGYSR